MPVDEVTFLVGVISIGLTLLAVGWLVGRRLATEAANRAWETRLPDIKKETRERSRTVLTGLFSEQLAPFLPDFPYRPNEVRFIGNPVDFVVFRGIEEREPQEVVILEVKSGASRLSTTQRKVRDVVRAGKVSWAEYRVPEDLSR